MAELQIPVGISEFRKIRENGYYYVDKTELIADILKKESTEVTLITRPRRFGKTLAMNMLADFFDIRKDSRKIFSGLKISAQDALCQKWMNRMPVIFFSLKDVDGLVFDTAYKRLQFQIANLYKQYAFLTENPDMDEDDKTMFSALKAGRGTDAETGNALATLTRLLCDHYHKPVILLIDEYDVPVAKASSHGYYEQMLDVIRLLISSALKDNPSLAFAVVTGCLKITKESIFTGTNNFVSDTISDSRLDEYFGFTQAEVDQLLEKSGFTGHASEIREWYDGYHFGKVDVYCPWDVMNYLFDLQQDPEAEPGSYWRNTSDNAIIRSFIDFSGSSITQKLETLLSGGMIVQEIDTDLTYDYLHASENNLWSVLYLTGYLTRVCDSDLAEPLKKNEFALTIPNREIREIYENTIVKWFQDSVQKWNRQALFAAVWAGDIESLNREISRLLRRTISYHDYREDFYHAFLAGIFAGAGYTVESNKEHGEGRSDIAVYDPVNSRAAVFETKYSGSLREMEKDCRSALDQIADKMYAREYEDDYDEVFCYGITFFRKRCLVAGGRQEN